MEIVYLLISHHFRNVMKFPFESDVEDVNAASRWEFLALFKCVS